MDRFIVIALPAFALMILAEYGYGWVKGRNTYRVDEAMANLSQGLLSQITVLFTGAFHVGVYGMVLARVAPLPGQDLWQHWYGWALALLLVDFCGYWAHRSSHGVAILWAAHAVHHQSRDFNFTVALRQESAYPLLGFLFFLPLALLGMPVQTYLGAELSVLLYQIWVHTEHVGRLGWFDRIFSSPSNHRVHHAVNDAYVDRNFGGVLIVWDRLFGTYLPEGDEACVYGTRQPMAHGNPLWANLVGYAGLVQECRRVTRLPDRLRLWFMPPHWLRPGDARGPPPASGTEAGREAAAPDTATWAGSLQFLALVAATAAYLWFREGLPFALSAAAVLAIAIGLWVVASGYPGGGRGRAHARAPGPRPAAPTPPAETRGSPGYPRPRASSDRAA